MFTTFSKEYFIQKNGNYFDRFAQTENGGDFQSGKSTTICSNNKPQNEQTLSGLTYLGV